MSTSPAGLHQFDLSGKVAIVTGGNGGIGKGIALGLASAGADVVIAARNREKTAATVEELKATGRRILGLEVNVTDPTKVDEMVRRVLDAFGRIDILVNNAGGGVIRKQPQEYTPEEWDQVVDVNLRSVFLCCRAVYPAMKRQGGGKIINLGSVTAIFGSDWIASYAAAKGGVIQLTKSLAIAWAKDNIRVNALIPGWFLTDLTRYIKERTPERYERIVQRIPVGRWGEPHEIAGAAIFLASAASDYLTGVALPVDGGYCVV